MIKEQIKITSEEFLSWYTPMPGFALVEKDKPGEKFGKILMPAGSRERGMKYAGTGVIRRLSPFVADREPYDAKLRDIFTEGQRIAFSNTTPYDINMPAFCSISSSSDDKMLVLLHTADILGLIEIPDERMQQDGQH